MRKYCLVGQEDVVYYSVLVTGSKLFYSHLKTMAWLILSSMTSVLSYKV